MKKKTVVVTGASGFIGSRVCRLLVKNFDIIAVVSPFSVNERLAGIKPEIKISKVDLTDRKKVNSLIGKYKPFAILHLATHGVYTYQQGNTERILIGNYLMALNLLESAASHGVEKFVNTGTVFEYGSQNKKVSEEDIKLDDILNQYSAVKMATTALTNSYSEKLNVITLRPFTTYGPDEDETRFIRATIQRASKNQPIKIAGDVVRDFVYVDDVARAYYLTLIKNYKSGEILNIAGGKKVTLNSVAKLIKKITNSKSEITIDNKYKRNKESACWANIKKAKIVLGWCPEYSLYKGLRNTVDLLKK